MKTSHYLSREPEERPITPEELSKHNSANDMWVGIRNGPSGKFALSASFN